MHVELSLRDLITPGEALKQKRLVVVESNPVSVYLIILLGFWVDTWIHSNLRPPAFALGKLIMRFSACCFLAR